MESKRRIQIRFLVKWLLLITSHLSFVLFRQEMTIGQLHISRWGSISSILKGRAHSVDPATIALSILLLLEGSSNNDITGKTAGSDRSRCDRLKCPDNQHSQTA